MLDLQISVRQGFWDEVTVEGLARNTLYSHQTPKTKGALQKGGGGQEVLKGQNVERKNGKCYSVKSIQPLKWRSYIAVIWSKSFTKLIFKKKKN